MTRSVAQPICVTNKLASTEFHTAVRTESVRASPLYKTGIAPQFLLCFALLHIRDLLATAKFLVFLSYSWIYIAHIVPSRY